jgi:hypothetical protein
MTYISVRIDIDDVISDLSHRAKQEMTDKLYDDGYVATKDSIPTIEDSMDDFDSSVAKLIGNAWKLSQEDVDIILNISNKLI